MTALWIILTVLAFFALLLLLRVGVRAEFDDGGLTLKIKAGAIYIPIISPDKPKKEKPEKPKKEKKPKKKTEPEEKEKKTGKVSFFLSLISDVLDILGRFKRKIKIDELTVWYLSASNDPAKAAMTFGAASAGMGIVTGILENNFKIKKRDFRAAVDFQKTEPEVYVKAELSLAIWEILYIVLKPGYNVLKKYQKLSEPDKK
jgi:hypothetical protein